MQYGWRTAWRRRSQFPPGVLAAEFGVLSAIVDAISRLRDAALVGAPLLAASFVLGEEFGVLPAFAFPRAKLS